MVILDGKKTHASELAKSLAGEKDLAALLPETHATQLAAAKQQRARAAA